MKCPITYENVDSHQKTSSPYSLKGLHHLDKKLDTLKKFEYTQDELLDKITKPETRISISGENPKLLINLNKDEKKFEITMPGGKYILKPQSPNWPQMPENEDLTMKLADRVGIETPKHGLLYCKGDYFFYFIRRFDRGDYPYKIPLENFAQLQGKTREGKYDSSMEKVAKTIEQYCAFPTVEKKELFKRTIFIYLTGHQDMHLKNFSLITINSVVMLSPVYNLINSTIVDLSNLEEIALPLNSKRRGLTKEDLTTYYGVEKLNLTSKVIDEVLSQFSNQVSQWKELINSSFLSEELKKKYIHLLDERKNKLGL